MKTLRLLALTSVLALLAPLFMVTPAYAEVRCETQYGGGQVCVSTGNLQVNKRVCDPGQGSCDPNDAKFTSRLVDNLGSDSHNFKVGEEAVFQIDVKNAGDATFGDVSVSDTLPAQLDLSSGNLSYDIPNLAPGQTNSRIIRAKVNNNFPSGQSKICVINTVDVNSQGQHDRDTSQVCLSRAPVTSLPKAGPEDWWMLPSLALLSSSTGFYLLKKNRI